MPPFAAARLAIVAVAALGFGAGALNAQSMTTAAEVRPILDITRANWIAVRDYDGKDFLYFTGILAWRCGVSAIFYGLNGAPAETPFEMEPCHDGTPTPNAILSETIPIWINAPQGSIATVAVRIVYDDGSEDQAEFDRGAVLTP